MGHRDLLVTHNLSEGKNHKCRPSPTRQRPPRQRLRSNGQPGSFKIWRSTSRQSNHKAWLPQPAIVTKVQLPDLYLRNLNNPGFWDTLRLGTQCARPPGCCAPRRVKFFDKSVQRLRDETCGNRRPILPSILQFVGSGGWLAETGVFSGDKGAKCLLYKKLHANHWGSR